MEKKPGKKNFLSKGFNRLVEARWFFAMSASMVATITGISLTFGINSCRDNQRKNEEKKKSMLQAVDNLADRFQDAEEWISALRRQSDVYNYTDSVYFSGGHLTDSICEKFRYTMPFVKISAFDHEFEKVFRGSYQLWQLQNNTDSLAFYICLCYDGLNIVEKTCEELTEGMLEKIGEVNSRKSFNRLPPREWTVTLLEDPNFQYYMSVRKVKAEIAGQILRMAKKDFDENVKWRAAEILKK